MLSKKWIPFWFLITYLGLFFYYNYDEVIMLSPIGEHQWRQSDGASFARCYAQEGMSFFNPMLHNLDGQRHAVSEFPILYYLAAVGHRLFDTDDNLVRIIHWIVFIMGLYALSLIYFHYLENALTSVLLALSVTGYPVLTYYSLNFVPDTPALGFFLIGVFFYVKYNNSNKKWFLIFSLMAITLAGLIKPTFYYLILAFLGTAIVVRIIDKKKVKEWVPSTRNIVLGLLSVFVVVFSWYTWVDWYNDYHQTSYFLRSPRPIWEMSHELRTLEFEYIYWFSSKVYWHPINFPLFILMGFVILGLVKSLWIRIGLIFLIGGGFCYFMLFAGQLKVHNYYITELYPIIIFIMISFVASLTKKIADRKQWIIMLLAFIYFMGNIQYGQNFVLDYYSENHGDIKLFPEVFQNDKHEVKDYLSSLDITYPDKVISVPDFSPNQTLLYMNLIGWTETIEKMNRNKIQEYADKGAKALITTNLTWLKDSTYLDLLPRQIGDFQKQLFIFDLQNLKK